MGWEPSWPDPCNRCRHATVHRLEPIVRDGVLLAQHTCPACRHVWLDEAEVDLTMDDIVRAYDGDETYVGFVGSIDGDDLEVGGRRVKRWQVVVY